MRLGSSSTSSRGRSFPGRYRKIAPNSQVDESLFGNPDSVASRRSSGVKEKERSLKNREGEMVQIITKDLIRTLRVPRKDPPGESTILPPVEFHRMTSASHILIREEREAKQKASQLKKEEDLKASEDRKNLICKVDESRRENPVLTELELEARDRAQRLVERANALRMEQEDEIKQLNQLILGAQCQATRDVQMNEKKLNQEEMAEEERRLDAMMEVERCKALETISKIDELRKQQRIRGMQQIYEQIQQRLLEKQVQDEMKDQESQQFREKQEQMNLEDLRALEKKREEQKLLQGEIMRINAETMHAKEQRKEQEKLADLRDLEYIRQKMEREAEYEAEQRRIKKEKELEIARLRAQQERAKDHKAEQDELRARRNQEAMDREWRRAEKELAVKKAQEEAMLRAARREQVRNKEQCLSTEAGRERAEFDRVLKVQKEAMAKEKEQQERQHENARRHAHAIRQQMQERELSAAAKRREFFKEADRRGEEARLRQQRLHEIKEKKLRDLRATGLSDKYCKEVERKTRTCLA
ncbi:cilia- and flagella-associated protein 45 [Salarias fasciatus]|uniref:cilia- and flagella-associated protein 45 n=1 Tax=Salarias fasciatus TaxID=181472 RepID=UPI00117656A8|nr:cilia- and flagella-associated protein 45-like [Salarias fasciatus]